MIRCKFCGRQKLSQYHQCDPSIVKCSFCGDKGYYVVLFDHEGKDVCWKCHESDFYWAVWGLRFCKNNPESPICV